MAEEYTVKKNPTLIDISVIEDIKAEIKKLNIIGYADIDGKREIAKRAVLDIIDKHIGKQEG